MKIIVAESGVEPYEYNLELTDPLFVGQNYFSDWSQINNNLQTGKFETSATGLFAGTYTLSLRDGLGCTQEYVLVIKADMELFIPNIFTPNGDDSNEEFYIRNLLPNTVVMITDRWGKQIYFSTDYKNDWNGGDSPDGVYYYTISQSEKTYSGWVEILRGAP
jgi:gliding motility-associated-like protein